MKELLITLAMLRAGDLATTQNILNHAGVEQNMVLSQRPAANLTVGIASTAGEMAAIYWIDKKNHKVGRWLAIGAIAVEAFAVAHNSAQIARR